MSDENERIVRLHRRIQQLEGPFQSRLAGVTAGRDYWSRRARDGADEVERLTRALKSIQWLTRIDRQYPVSDRVYDMATKALDGKEATP